MDALYISRWCLISLLLLQSTSAVNILFLFGGANYSHKLSIWPLVLALSDKGYNVTFVSSVAKQPKPSSRITDITPSFYTKATDQFFNVDRIKNREKGDEVVYSPYEPVSVNICQKMMNSQEDPAFNQVIQSGKFDLIVINSVFGECAFYLTHHLRSKYVMYVPCVVYDWFYGIFGLQLENSWIPDFVSRDDAPLNFWSRIKVMFKSYIYNIYTDHFSNTVREIYMKRFGLTEAPELVELQRNASLVLVNSHFSTDFARSLPPLFRDVGGMPLWEKTGELPQNFKDFMDSYENGVILISFGSTIEFSTLDEVYRSMFFNMMRKFKTVGFIWRWNGELPANQPTNLMAAKWLPQKEILREKSVRALMTHGGLNSVQEATYYGVPLIVMPFFSDQDFNAYRIIAQKVGVKLEAATLSQESLNDAFSEILTNPMYKKNMVTRSTLFKDRPDPKQTAIEALEFVLRHDDFSALKPMEMNQSFWVRQHVEVYVFYFSIFLVINLLIPFAIFWVCRKCW